MSIVSKTLTTLLGIMFLLLLAYIFQIPISVFIAALSVVILLLIIVNVVFWRLGREPDSVNKESKKMTIERIIKKEIDIMEVTLLSHEEYESAKEAIPKIHEPTGYESPYWWLRAPLKNQVESKALRDKAIYEDNEGWVSAAYVDHIHGVRPALRINNSESIDLKIKNKFVLAGYKWTMILPSMALCDSIVGWSPFHKDCGTEYANMYEHSDIKRWLENWEREKGIMVEE